MMHYFTRTSNQVSECRLTDIPVTKPHNSRMTYCSLLTCKTLSTSFSDLLRLFQAAKDLTIYISLNMKPLHFMSFFLFKISQNGFTVQRSRPATALCSPITSHNFHILWLELLSLWWLSQLNTKFSLKLVIFIREFMQLFVREKTLKLIAFLGFRHR